MITRFKSKALRKLFGGDPSKVNPQRAQLMYDILQHLNAATEFKDLEMVGRRLHSHNEHSPVKWSLDVNGNYRIMFEWDDINKNVTQVDLLDPH